MMIHDKQKIDVLKADSNLWLEVLEKVQHDIYHLPGYFELEAKRHKGFSEAILIQKGDCLFFAPYLLQNCNQIFSDTPLETEVFDATSPYGYSGILINQAATQSPNFIGFAMGEMQRILQSKQVCSAFFRLHPLINHNLPYLLKENIFQTRGKTVSVDLLLTYDQIWSQTKADRRNKINKCKRLNLISKIVDFDDYIQEFISIYKDTMERVGATRTYFEFDYDYCVQMKELLGDHLHLCIVESEDKIASAGLYTEYQGIVQALFGGTRTEFFKVSPSSLETDYMRLWAKERGNKVLHLGGGLGGTKDSLYEFKSSFSKQNHLFLTMQLIIDPEKYNYLLEKRAKYFNIDPQELMDTNFFPVYRCPSQKSK